MTMTKIESSRQLLLLAIKEFGLSNLINEFADIAAEQEDEWRGYAEGFVNPEGDAATEAEQFADDWDEIHEAIESIDHLEPGMMDED